MKVELSCLRVSVGNLMLTPVKPSVAKVRLVVIPLLSEWTTITAVTKSVVSDVVNCFAKELN